MKISTFAAFYRLMLERCNPQTYKTAEFRLLCERMWFDGQTNRSVLARECNISRPTAVKWAQTAEALGIRSDQRRRRDLDSTLPPPPAPPTEAEINAAIAAEDTNHHEARKARAESDIDMPVLGGDADLTHPRYDLTTEELRDLARRRATHDLLEARTGDHAARAVDTLAKVVPNFKAPEVSVQVQAFVGSGAADTLLAAVRESMQILVENDEDFIRELLSSPATAHLLPVATEAEDEGSPQDARPADNADDTP